MGDLYDEKYYAEADEIEATIRKQSFYDGFFHDHALRGKNGKLTVVDSDITEACQYYAFFTGIATKELYPDLWKVLLEEFGPEREKTGLWQNICPSVPFMGEYLRLSILEMYGETNRLLKNIEDYFYHMAQTTNTLWETRSHTSSHNHGFASMVAVWLEKYAH